jgi:hypothetical protein
VRRSNWIRSSRARGRSVVAGFADQSASSAHSPSTLTESLLVRSMINTAQSRTNLRACGLKLAISDASISPLMLITVRSASVRIQKQGSRRLVSAARFGRDGRGSVLRPVIMCKLSPVLQEWRNGRVHEGELVLNAFRARR